MIACRWTDFSPPPPPPGPGSGLAVLFENTTIGFENRLRAIPKEGIASSADALPLCIKSNPTHRTTEIVDGPLSIRPFSAGGSPPSRNRVAFSGPSKHEIVDGRSLVGCAGTIQTAPRKARPLGHEGGPPGGFSPAAKNRKSAVPGVLRSRTGPSAQSSYIKGHGCFRTAVMRTLISPGFPNQGRDAHTASRPGSNCVARGKSRIWTERCQLQGHRATGRLKSGIECRFGVLLPGAQSRCLFGFYWSFFRCPRLPATIPDR